MNLIEQLEALQVCFVELSANKTEKLVLYDDLRAIIEQAKLEAVELNKLEQDYEDLNRDYCLVLASRDSLLKENSNLKAYQKHEKSLAQEMFLQEINDLRQEVESLKSAPYPDHTKLIGELVEALDVLRDFASAVGGSSSFWDEVWPKHDEALTKAREAIK